MILDYTRDQSILYILLIVYSILLIVLFSSSTTGKLFKRAITTSGTLFKRAITTANEVLGSIDMPGCMSNRICWDEGLHQSIYFILL